VPKENEPKERAPVPLGPPASGCLHKLFSAAGSKTRCFCNFSRSRQLLKSSDGFLPSTLTPLKQFAPFIRGKQFIQLRVNGGGIRAGERIFDSKNQKSRSTSGIFRIPAFAGMTFLKVLSDLLDAIFRGFIPLQHSRAEAVSMEEGSKLSERPRSQEFEEPMV
jgi:hypothetical protein